MARITLVPTERANHS